MTSSILLILAALVVLAAGFAILMELRGRPAVFERLYMTAMLLAVLDLVFICVQALRGVMSLADVVLAIASGAVSAFCIFYGFFGITEGDEAADAARAELMRRYREGPPEASTPGPDGPSTTGPPGPPVPA